MLQSPKNRVEQAIVARGIRRALDPVSVWVAAADEPVLVKVQNVQHLATPIRAQLAEPISAVELAGAPASHPCGGGRAGAVAEPLIPALEGLDRGWYAGRDRAGPTWRRTASSAWRCGARCCAARWRTSTPAAGSSPTPSRSTSWRRPRSSSQALLPLLT